MAKLEFSKVYESWSTTDMGDLEKLVYATLFLSALGAADVPEMRAAQATGCVCSPLSLADIAVQLGVPQHSVARATDSLKLAGWLKLSGTLYQVAQRTPDKIEVFATPKTRTPKVASELAKPGTETRKEQLQAQLQAIMARKKLQTNVAQLQRASDVLRKDAIKSVQGQKAASPAGRLFQVFSRRHWEVFGTKYVPQSTETGRESMPKEYKLQTRVLQWCNNSELKTIATIEYLIVHWEEVKLKHKYMGPCNIGVLATTKLFVSVQQMMGSAKVGTAADRYVDTGDAVSGW